MNNRRLLPALLLAPLLMPATEAQAKTAIEDTLHDACLRLAVDLADSTNLTSGQQLLRNRCIALRRLRENRGEAAYQAVLKQISPEQISSQQRASRDGARMQSRNVGQRIGQLRTRQRSGRSVSVYSDGAGQIGASAGNLDVSRWGAFINGNVDTTSKDATDREPAYDSDATGITAGIDYRISPQWVTGIAIGQTDASTDYDAQTGTLDTEAQSALFYIAFSSGGWSVDLVLGQTDTENTNERKIDYSYEDSLVNERVNSQPKGSSDSTDESAYLSTDYQFQRGGFSYGPYLAVESIKTDIDAFSESQAEGWGIGYAPQSNRTTRYEAGGKGSWVQGQSWGVLTFGGVIGFSHYDESELDPVEARLLFDELQTRTFQMRPDQLDRDYQTLGLNGTAIFAGGLSAFVSFEQYFDYADLDFSTLTMGLRAEL